MQSALSKFDKGSEMGKLSDSLAATDLGAGGAASAPVVLPLATGPGGAEVKLGGYSKSSFFDTISCDALDKGRGGGGGGFGGGGPARRETEKRLNTETFGAVALNDNRRNFRGGGGYRGRGRGRGGF